jgi:hypothetical protein
MILLQFFRYRLKEAAFRGSEVTAALADMGLV